MEALTDAVGLRVIGFGAGMFNIIERQIELIIVSLWLAAIFRASVGQNTDQAHVLFCKEG